MEHRICVNYGESELTLQVGECYPDSVGRIIREIFFWGDEVVIKTTPPPAQGSCYSFPKADVVEPEELDDNEPTVNT